MNSRQLLRILKRNKQSLKRPSELSKNQLNYNFEEHKEFNNKIKEASDQIEVAKKRLQLKKAEIKKFDEVKEFRGNLIQ